MEKAIFKASKNSFTKEWSIQIQLEKSRKSIKFTAIDDLKKGIEALGQNFEKIDKKRCDVEIENGKVVQIDKDGKTVFKQINGNVPKPIDSQPKVISSLAALKGPVDAEASFYQMTKSKLKQEHVSNIPAERQARAPYNFVPLNETFVRAPRTEEKSPHPCDADRYHKDRHTGYIDLSMTTKTPVYIRGLLNEAELAKGQEHKNNPNFFAPDGKPAIPGSSLRGLIRQMVEMVSQGKFVHFDDKRLYFRDVAGSTKLKKDYADIMVDANDSYFPKIKAGILISCGNNKYQIRPSRSLEGTQFYRINFNKRTGAVEGSQNLFMRDGDFKFREIYFEPSQPKRHQHYRWNPRTRNKDIPYFLKYARLKSVSLEASQNHPQRGFIIASGAFNSKHMHWVINDADANKAPIELSEHIINNYRSDINRTEEADLLAQFKRHAEVPCFYVTDDKNKIFAFGHTGMFRLAYEKTIGEHIPEDLKNHQDVDFAEAIFGRGDHDPLGQKQDPIVGRVSFEDAYYTGTQNPEDIFESVAEAKILSAPKPTSFQHYLVQADHNMKTLNHYNDSTAIRGYKQYWHQSGNHWQEIDREKLRTDQEKPPEKRQYTKIKPVKPNTVFQGKIHFENLSSEELGALLFSLDLPEGCYHKIGMGKPLGLGSIHIQTRLCLSDRKTRYSDLFSEWLNPIAETQTKEAFVETFSNYVKAHIYPKQTGSLWDLPRLKELKTMLTFNHRNQNLSYMEIEKPDPKEKGGKCNEYKNRPVLPQPSEIG